MKTLGILPVKRFSRAKQRLAPELDNDARAALAEAMVRDVLRAVARVEDLAGLVLVTQEPRAAALGPPFGAVVVRDPDEEGQSQAASLGVARARELGAARVLLLPGDCPALEPGEVDALLRAHTDSPSVVIVPDRHGSGTNALLLSPPDVIAPAFGPGSFTRHREAAQRAGVPFAVDGPPSIVLDIDTGGDLAALREARVGQPPLGTLIALDSLERGERVVFAGG
jgi:2-phospho-L-lactate/phosphoenolpyruvate guanylyltransferase